jgi:hypothetical protein
MTDDPSDLDNLRLPPGVTVRRVVPKKLQKRHEHFVKVPHWWIERLARARHISTYRVALRVLYRHWKSRGQPFALGNGAMAVEGVNRWRKWDGLRELEHLELITVERRPRKSPLVTCNVANPS